MPLKTRADKIKLELATLDKIIKNDKTEVNMNGGSKVGLVIGLMLTISSVVATVVYIIKQRQKHYEDFDEGGERDDVYQRI